MALEVSLGVWLDRPPQESLTTAQLVDELGFQRLWIGELATWDCFALATAIGLARPGVPMVLGPFGVAVRDPAMLAMGAASVRALTGREVDLAIGTSSEVVVEKWHGRSRRRSAQALDEALRTLRPLVWGDRSHAEGEIVRSHGYQLQLEAPRSRIAVAAFGPRAIRTAVDADVMVVNMVSPQIAADLVDQVERAAAELEKPRPRTAAWVLTTVDPTDASMTQLKRALVGYLAAPGYSTMFEREGFGDLVAFAKTFPHPREIFDRIPEGLVRSIGVIGSTEEVISRLSQYRRAGIDDLVVVPTATVDDPSGERTLRAVASMRGVDAPFHE